MPVGQGLVYDVIKDTWCPAPSLPPHLQDYEATNVSMAGTEECENISYWLSGHSTTVYVSAAGGKVYVLCSDGTVYASAIPIDCIDPVCENHQTINATVRQRIDNRELVRITEGKLLFT